MLNDLGEELLEFVFVANLCKRTSFKLADLFKLSLLDSILKETNFQVQHGELLLI